MGGLAQQAEGTTEAKAECSESARQVKSDGRTRVRFVKERGTEESPAVQLRMGCAEPPAPDMGSGERPQFSSFLTIAELSALFMACVFSSWFVKETCQGTACPF